jgi:hypothetical protein
MSVDKMAHEIKPGDTLAWTDVPPEEVVRVVIESGLVRVYSAGRHVPFAFTYRERVSVEEASQ